MEANGDYNGLGYAHVRGLIPVEVARAFMVALKQDLGPQPIELSSITEHGPQLKRPTFQIYGANYPPMSFFLWALTPTISELIGRDLLPSYDYFRIYREGDVCLVHSDRPSCEHSVSLTLDYSDGEVWDLQVAHDRTATPLQAAEDFGASEFSSVGMKVGDAVLYQGVHHRHGRITPNPNGWSAHLFLHFVERGGPYEEYAFDKRLTPQSVNFSFA
jgi:hypothetical protein